MALYRVIVPFSEGPSEAAGGAEASQARYTGIQVEAESEAEAKRLAVAEFEEMAGLSRPGRRPHAIEGEIRVERAPVTRRAALEVATALPSPGIAVVRVVGAVNAHNFHHLQQGLDDLAAKGTSRLVLDLSALTYINSTGMSLLVAAGDLFDMRLAAVPARITRLFRMIGLHEIFPTYMSVAEAAKAPKAGPD